MLLPRRARESSKRDYGRLLIVGGSTGFSGAPTLASRAAVRAGAGLVYLAVPQSIYQIAAVKNDEAMVLPLPSNALMNGCVTGLTTPQFDAAAVCCDVIAAGPGLGRADGAVRLLSSLGRKYGAQLVLDADALWALSKLRPDFLAGLEKPAVLTPHEGEFRRCLGCEISPSRPEAACRYAVERRCILVLKGADTVVAFPDGTYYVNSTGNPGLARGGSGDALTGIMGALLCQFQPEKAVPLAVFLHGLAGDLAAEARGEYGMTVTDVIDFLPEAMKLIMEE